MNDRLTILLTNIWLAEWAGSEVVVRDLALGLLQRGHRPIVYSPWLGAMAEEIASRGVSVIDDLRKLGEPPDIIHAHHHVPCGEALIRFPHVPAIYVCHSFVFWGEAPVHFPQIGAYVAVDEACRDRLVHTEGIDAGRVVVLRNAVDLRRIPPRPLPLRERPQRAIAFAKATAAPEVRIACERLGIEFQALGRPADRVSAHPEQQLVQFDLVFASARAALEALCCGCAVIACDQRGFAGLVTSGNYDSLRERNFGLRSLGEPLTVDRLIQEIRCYDPAEALRVTQRARDDADLDRLLDHFEQLYAEVLTGRRRPQVSADARAQAVARFLHENLPRRPLDGRWPWMTERDHLQREIGALEAKAADWSHRLSEAERERDGVRRQLSAAEREGDEVRRQLSAASAQFAELKRSRLLKIGRLIRRIARLPVPY